jgi:RHS repeat-associated protein
MIRAMLLLACTALIACETAAPPHITHPPGGDDDVWTAGDDDDAASAPWGSHPGSWGAVPDPHEVWIDPPPGVTPLDGSAPFDICSATEFLYTGPDPVQLGVDVEVLDCDRLAVIRGVVVDEAGVGLSDVEVTVKDREEYGSTWTRDDGGFDLAVNGGGWLTLVFSAADRLPMQRRLSVPWKDYVWIHRMTMIHRDAHATEIDLDRPASMQVALGSASSDSDGERQAVTLFPPQVEAEMLFADGSTRAMSGGDLRLTEYTVGDDGPNRMPGDLPLLSAYTYAVDASFDEAVAEGAESVEFSEPVTLVVDNFLGFPVGEIVPVGTFDEQLTAWVPSRNGRVIEILEVTDGLASIDVDGLGVAATDEQLDAHGVTADELAELAGLYLPGDTLWRAQLEHFTAVDYNWGFGAPAWAEVGGDLVAALSGDFCTEAGSVIRCQTQALGERVELPGTPYTLQYWSDRARGWQAGRNLKVQVTDDTLPADLVGVTLVIQAAGRTWEPPVAAAPDQLHELRWDGIDGYNRQVQGATPAMVRVGYEYEAAYTGTPEFGAPPDGVPITVDPVRETVTLWNDLVTTIGFLDAQVHGLGGWSLDVHHAYDPVARKVHLGSGGSQSGGGDFEHTLVDQYASYEPAELTVGPDGCTYVAEKMLNHVTKYCPDRTWEVVAGNGASFFSGDGGPATQASLYWPQGLAFHPDGHLYIADTGNHRIRKVDIFTGEISTVAGTGNVGHNGDNIPAEAATLHSPTSIAIASDGNIYVADTNNQRVRRIDPAGTITTCAGTGAAGFSGDGGPAAAARLYSPNGVAVDGHGNVYVADKSNRRIRKIRTDGQIETVAGNGDFLYNGDGMPAEDAALYSPMAVAVDDSGNLYIADHTDSRIRWVDSSGTIHTIAGTGEWGFSGGGGPAVRAEIGWPEGVTVSPDGDVLFSDTDHHMIRRIGASSSFATIDELAVPAEDGSEVWIFGLDGQHHRTLDALTGDVMVEFAYNSGLLTAVTDAFGNTTVIDREIGGAPVSITAPSGQRTELELDADGLLERVLLPGNLEYTVGYIPGSGLLDSFEYPAGGSSSYSYDADGLLSWALNPDGEYRTLSNTSALRELLIETNTALGRAVSYHYEYEADGDWRQDITGPTGAESSFESFVDASTRTIHPDGLEFVAGYEGDPRWQMTAPAMSQWSLGTPQGRALTAVERQTVVLDDPANPLSVATLSIEREIDGRSFLTTFDGSSRTLTSTTPEGREVRTEIGDGTRVDELWWHPDVEPLVFERDGYGRLERLARGDEILDLEYDATWRVDTITDASGAVGSFTYGQDDRLETVTPPGQHTYRVDHDAEGRLSWIQTPDGEEHTLGHTAAGKPLSYTPPGGGGAYTLHYDGDGSPSGLDLPTGRQITIDRLPLDGRPSSVSYDEAEIAISYAADTDRPSVLTWQSALTSEFHTTTLDYDGHLVTHQAVVGAVNGSYDYDYDSEMNLDNTRLTFGLATEDIPLQLDGDGLVVEQGAFSFDRSGPAGQVATLSGSGLDRVIGFDDLGRPAEDETLVAGRPIYALSLERDLSGRIESRTEILDGTLVEFWYEYDPDGQLLGVWKDGTQVESYAYDPDGNRLVPSATYGARDQLQTLGNLTYTFDDDGFLFSRGADTFTYSARWELLAATVDGMDITYTADHLGRRASRTDDLGTHEFLYGDLGDPFRLTASRDSDGIVTTYHYDPSGHLMALNRAWPNPQTYLVATDQVGTPRVVTDTSGQILKRLEYDSFGVPLSDTNPTFELLIGFAGGLNDPDTGLVRFGLRDYDPESGRWTAIDPILFAGGQLNLYAYCGSDPVGLRDPSGMVVPALLIPTVLGGVAAGVGFQLGLELRFAHERGYVDFRDVALGGVSGGSIAAVWFFSASSTLALGVGAAVVGGLVFGFAAGLTAIIAYSLIEVMYHRYVAQDFDAWQESRYLCGGG